MSENGLHSNALQIIENLTKGVVKPIDINTANRRACVDYLKQEGYPDVHCAKLFDVSRQTIIVDKKAILEDYLPLINTLDVKREATRLIARGRYLADKAVRGKQYAVAWKIEKELNEQLQSMGFIHRAPEEIKHSGSISIEDKRAELAARYQRLGKPGEGISAN